MTFPPRPHLARTRTAPTGRASRSGTAVPRHAAEPVLDPRAAAATAARGVGVPVLVAAVVTAGAPGWSTYTVRRGDTLSGIAKSHGTSVREIVRANHLPAHGNLVIAGKAIRLPVKAPVVRSVKVRHTVHTGDSLWTVARRYSTTIPALVRANGLKSTVVQPGQQLTVGVQKVVVSRGTTTATRKATSTNTFASRTYPASVVAAASRNRAALARTGVPTRDQMRRVITRIAGRHGVPADLALAVSWQESGWRQDRVSVANAIGAMQVVPSTGAWISGVIGRKLDLLDPEDNATAGVVLLQVLLNQAKESDSIAGYYQGLASVRKNGYFADTKQYVASVTALKSRMG